MQFRCGHRSKCAQTSARCRITEFRSCSPEHVLPTGVVSLPKRQRVRDVTEERFPSLVDRFGWKVSRKSCFSFLRDLLLMENDLWSLARFEAQRRAWQANLRFNMFIYEFHVHKHSTTSGIRLPVGRRIFSSAQKICWKPTSQILRFNSQKSKFFLTKECLILVFCS